jgi:nitric oxide reductase subunit B
VWNFLGAGVFGFLINLPVVSYYEIGTALTANHGHTAMMGVYGMLAIGLLLFCLRYLTRPDKWSDRAAKISFWSTEFLNLPWVNALEWARLPGDALFIVGGALPLFWLCAQALRYPNPRRIEAESELAGGLFTYESDVPR